MGSSGKVIHKSEQQKKGDVGKHVNREMCIKQFNTSFVAATAICIWKSHREHCKLVVVHSDTVCISCPRVQSPPPHATYVVFYTTYILKKRKRKENLLYLSVQVLHGQPRVALSQTLPRKATIGQGELQAGGRQKRWWGGVVWQDAILDQRMINS